MFNIYWTNCNTLLPEILDLLFDNYNDYYIISIVNSVDFYKIS